MLQSFHYMITAPQHASSSAFWVFTSFSLTAFACMRKEQSGEKV